MFKPLLLQGVNVCNSGASGAPHSRWQPASSSPISMAAALGSYLAVCSGSTVHLLDLNPQFGQVNTVQVFEFLQQVSAVSCFQAGRRPEEVRLLRQHHPCLLKLIGQCSMFNEEFKYTSNPTALHHFPFSGSQQGSWTHSGVISRLPTSVRLTSTRTHHATSSQTGCWKHAAGCLQAGAAWLVVGQWVSNTVELRQLSANGRSQTLHLGERQPRALLAAYLAGRQHLFIGTSDGAVLFCSMTCSAGGQLQHQQSAQGRGPSGMLETSSQTFVLCCAS